MTIEANKRFFNSIDEVPRQAYTMGIATIMRAKCVLMVVSGKDKAILLWTDHTSGSGFYSAAASELCFDRR